MPWRFEDVQDLISFTGDAPWHGTPKPAPVEPWLCPRGLVVALLGVDLRPVGALELLEPGADPLEQVERHFEAAAADATLRVGIFDGATGEPVLVLGNPNG